MSCNLKEFKEFIDNEMLLILGQMDKPSLIFDHLYLVSGCELSQTLEENPLQGTSLPAVHHDSCVVLSRAPNGMLPIWRSSGALGE